jgi:hypothetical protein
METPVILDLKDLEEMIVSVYQTLVLNQMIITSGYRNPVGLRLNYIVIWITKYRESASRKTNR